MTLMAAHLSIDIETYSSVDLKKAGLYKYVQSRDFQILLFAWSFNGGKTQVLDLMDARGQEALRAVGQSLFSPNVIKHAYNAPFEWYCLSKYFGLLPGGTPVQCALDQSVHCAEDWLPQWRCTMLHGLYCGYTAGLAATGQALGLEEDKQKLRTGSALIRTFCTPCKPSKANGGRNRTLPYHEPEKWRLFKEYCRQDVVTEMAIEDKLAAWPVPPEEQRRWELDQITNARGIKVDRDLIDGALYCHQNTAEALAQEATKLTGLDNPNSVSQLTPWLEGRLGYPIDDLRKDTVTDLLSFDLPADARRALEIRRELGKTSVKKYQAMEDALCEDGRIRGLLQFYGANRTGRWAGRLVQVQNLPRNSLDALDFARNCVQKRKLDLLRWCYGNVPDILSQLIRTTFVPSDNCRFLVADFSAIEARVIAWLAGESWRQEVFATHGKIYEASASAMFGVPLEKIKKGNPEYELRQKGKIAELALGYGGSAGALITMGALRMGLTEDELPEIVQRWRTANQCIVRLWHELENAVLQTMRTGQPGGVHGLLVALEGDYNKQLSWLTIQLPSGRKLFYAQPKLVQNQFEREALSYHGMDQQTKKWIPITTYGGKLVENVVQAIARDCLAVSIERLEAAGYRVVMHVHDEVILDVPGCFGSLEEACGIMAKPIDWAPGLLLRADGFETEYYKKE